MIAIAQIVAETDPCRTPADTEGARRCLVTGVSAPRAGLIRFVAGPDGTVVPDLGEKLPGRGLWVAADRAALERADARAFARANHGAVKVPGDLAAQVEAGLLRRLIDYLGIAESVPMTTRSGRMKSPIAEPSAIWSSRSCRRRLIPLVLPAGG